MRMGGTESPNRVGVNEPVGVTGVARLEVSLSPSKKWKRCRWNLGIGDMRKGKWRCGKNMST